MTTKERNQPSDRLTDIPVANGPQVEDASDASPQSQDLEANAKPRPKAGREVGGPKGLEPTRYGDWESKGRCYDF